MTLVRLLLVSDIHANLAALDAVLEDAARHACARVLCLGDALGYGPQPAEVLARLQGLNAECILGNHDLWALELARGEDAGLREEGVVARALRWQVGQLPASALAWVGSWPEVRDEDFGGVPFRARHGSPASLLEYVNSLARAREAFAVWAGRFALVGHTHLAAAYVTLSAPSGEWIKHQSLAPGGRFPVPPGARVIFNPGSVGQPRDGDPRASYAVFDAARETFEVFRVPYDVDATRAAVRAAELPDVLGARLAVGQ